MLDSNSAIRLLLLRDCCYGMWLLRMTAATGARTHRPVLDPCNPARATPAPLRLRCGSTSTNPPRPSVDHTHGYGTTDTPARGGAARGQARERVEPCWDRPARLAEYDSSTISIIISHQGRNSPRRPGAGRTL